MVEIEIDIKTVGFNLKISITTLNINDINITRNILSDWIKKQDPTTCWQKECHFKYKTYLD